MKEGHLHPDKRLKSEVLVGFTLSPGKPCLSFRSLNRSLAAFLQASEQLLCAAQRHVPVLSTTLAQVPTSVELCPCFRLG